jgi:hypothetical protein
MAATAQRNAFSGALQSIAGGALAKTEIGQLSCSAAILPGIDVTKIAAPGHKGFFLAQGLV